MDRLPIDAYKLSFSGTNTPDTELLFVSQNDIYQRFGEKVAELSADPKVEEAIVSVIHLAGPLFSQDMPLVTWRKPAEGTVVEAGADDVTKILPQPQ